MTPYPVVVREVRVLLPMLLLVTFALTSAGAHSIKWILDEMTDALADAFHILPFGLGKKLAKAVVGLARPLSDVLGRAAHASDAQVAKYFYGLARIFGEVFDAVEALAMLLVSVTWYVTKTAGVGVWHDLIRKNTAAIRMQEAQVQALRGDTHDLRKDLTHARSGPVGHAIQTRTKPIDARLAAMQGAITADIPYDLGALRDRAGALERLYHGARARLDRLGKTTVGLGAAALVVTALGRIGAGWLRCGNVRTLGKRLCGMNPSTLEDLLLGTLLVVGTISITEFAKELQSVMGEATAGIRGLIRE